MEPGKPKYHRSYWGELRVQLGVICAIEIMESILGITTLVFNSCNNISVLIRARIHPEAVESRWKQVDLISCLSDFYQSMDSGMSLVHVYKHQNSGRPPSTLTPLASINVRLGTLAEHIMGAFLLSSEKINTISIGISDPHVITSVSVHRSPVHSNISQYISYEISKLWLLQHWDDRNLTHTAYWDKIDLTLFEKLWETTTVHMKHFITKCMSNTLPNMTILQLRGHPTTNLYSVDDKPPVPIYSQEKPR